MTLKECYDIVGSYDEAEWRLGNEQRIRRYLEKVRRDDTFEGLCAAMDRGDAENAFLCAHNLKGMYLNLALNRAGRAAAALCDALRGGSITPEAPALFQTMKTEQERLIKSLDELLDGEVSA